MPWNKIAARMFIYVSAAIYVWFGAGLAGLTSAPFGTLVGLVCFATAMVLFSRRCRIKSSRALSLYGTVGVLAGMVISLLLSIWVAAIIGFLVFVVTLVLVAIGKEVAEEGRSIRKSA